MYSRLRANPCSESTESRPVIFGSLLGPIKLREYLKSNRLKDSLIPLYVFETGNLIVRHPLMRMFASGVDLGEGDREGALLRPPHRVSASCEQITTICSQ